MMRIPLDREKKIILLRWLKRGFIDTLDLPEAYRDSTLFFELLSESGMIEDGENENNKASTIEAKTVINN